MVDVDARMGAGGQVHNTLRLPATGQHLANRLHPPGHSHDGSTPPHTVTRRVTSLVRSAPTRVTASSTFSPSRWYLVRPVVKSSEFRAASNAAAVASPGARIDKVTVPASLPLIFSIFRRVNAWPNSTVPGV